MIFDYKLSSKKRKESLLSRSGWDLDILTNIIFLSSITNTDQDREFMPDNTDLTRLDVKLTVNGIEINLEKGLQRVVGILNDYELQNEKIDEAIHEFTNKLDELRR